MANDVGAEDIPLSYAQWVRAVWKFIGPSGRTPDPRGVVTAADIEFERGNTRGVLGTIARGVGLGDEGINRDETAEQLQLRNVLALRPAAQLTREPVPVRVPVTRPNAPLGSTRPPPPETAPRPVQGASGNQFEEFLRLFAMANGFGFGDVGNALGDFASILGNVRGVLGQGTQMVPTQFLAGPAGRAVIGGAAGAGIFEGAANLFGGGGKGGPTALQRIRSDAGRSVTRRQIIAMARNCGLDVAASTLSTSVENICEVVAKGMPRRGRGISSRDMSRTRSTLGKLNTMQRSLSGLCPTPRRRSTKR